MARLTGMIACVLILAQNVRSETKPADWVLTLDEEFDGKALDLSRWSPHDPQGLSNQRYTAEALQVRDGMLHIAGAGVLTSFGTFAQTYGRFEIRCRIPAGRGHRASFLLLPVPTGSLPGIEVFRADSAAPAKTFFANRWGTEQTERSYGESFTGPDLSTGFHTISMEWERDSIRWFVDGKEKFQSSDGVPRQPMYLLVNLAHSPGETNDTSASFDIDYIRVYARTK
jgi:beta-glucanase (GH16 family)